MLLKDYMPISCLEVDSHLVPTPKRPVFDVHTHWGEMAFGPNYSGLYDTKTTIKSMKSHGVIGCVNLCGHWGERLVTMLDKIGEHRDYVHTFGTVDTKKLEDPDWESYVHQTIRESVGAGMKGMKFWKNISLAQKDKSGSYIPIDDSRLQVIWQTAAEYSLPVLIHIADPVAFFKPIDRFNERLEELESNPDWAFNAPDLYTFHELMEQQDNLVGNNPNTTFVIAHFGSYPENLAWLGKQLDKHPNMLIDVAARIAELGRQPYTARKFFQTYRDRIMFGTDFTPVSHGDYPIYYRFFETFDEYFPYSSSPVGTQGRWNIYGIGLEDKILDQLYYRNAAKLLGLTSE